MNKAPRIASFPRKRESIRPDSWDVDSGSPLRCVRNDCFGRSAARATLASGIVGVFTALLLLAALFPASAGADNIDELKKEMQDRQARLEELQKMVEKERERLAEASGKEKTLLGDLDLIERKLRHQEKKIEELAGRIQVNRSNIGRIEKEIGRLEKEVAARKKALSRRLEAMYKFENGSHLKVLFASTSLGDLQKRRKFLGLIVESDRRLIDGLVESIDRLSGKRAELGKEEEELNRHSRELEATRRSLARDKKSRLAMIDSIRRDKDTYAKAIKEAESDSGKLQEMLDSLEEKIKKLGLGQGKTSGGSLADLKGLLSPPVKGPVISEFGRRENPEFHGVVTHNNGIEIEAREGRPIQAVAPGMVLWANWFKGYGNLIIIDHGAGFYTLYAHCSELEKKVGDEVKDREEIGKVGRTGSLKGSNLYFEIRQEGKAVNPRFWLRLPQRKD